MNIQLQNLTRDETLALIESNPSQYFEQFFAELGIEEKRVPNEFDCYSHDSFLKNQDINGFTLKKVHEVGGHEGEGEHAERTFALVEKSNGNVELAWCEITGFYDSYNGTEWEDNAYVVYPHQVTVTKYFPTKA